MRRWLMALVALNLLGLLLLVFVYPQFMVAPGPLEGGHAELETDCFACHAPLRGAQPERCIACHALADIGVRDSHGAPITRDKPLTAFHESLLENDCMSCHYAHRLPPLSHRDRQAFSHTLLATAVRERCESCHRAPRDKLHDKVDTGCALCHVDSHWRPASFDHDEYFKLDRHHDKACSRCHVDNDFKRYTCYGCHEHQPRKVAAEHREEGITDIEDCAGCHPDARESHARKTPRPRKTSSERAPTLMQ